tara:strand:+ start:211 stop:456 length:246 start_codon:yes stop_codon:yes gene_type:complete
MLQDRRRNKKVSSVVGGVGASRSKKDKKSKDSEAPGETNEGLVLALGSLLTAMRTDNPDLAIRSFRSAFKALVEEQSGWFR